ncbi:MAG TPA: DNA-directed RNA polymerase subunit beta', partial [Planctomycetota bacterium]|nr:DNA-directed RNA polymerase subunit beta' [Planctomycetota bacterium]
NTSNSPLGMVLDAVPVIPPDLRPMVQLDGGRFATSDLNDLYRRVINRNNRLKRLLDLGAPEIIVNNEKRMLQEAVDALFDNGRRGRPVTGPGNRPLKSLSDMLKGKQGRFRQNLLGKRVDYSGRSVIVVGPELKLHQCGLPKNMALELFKPFIIRKLEDKGFVQTVKSAKRLVERERPEVWDILGDIIKGHPVLLNRAPTLHRLGIQAFEPVLVEGKAIRIHPMVCSAFNADFDGDQMAVHVPLSFEAQIECRMLMLSTNNILLPSNGRPVATPSQDIVLGCSYLTKARSLKEGEKRKFYASAEEVRAAYDHKQAGLHDPITVRIDGKRHDSTVGRVIFNEVLLPWGIEFTNVEMDKKALETLVGDCHRALGDKTTAIILDALKNLGFTYATQAGITVGIDDIMIPPTKGNIITRAQNDVAAINRQYQQRVITDGERYNQVINTWTLVTTEVEEETFSGLAKDRDGFNPIFMMAHSGSRGTKEQIRQLAGMRGLMAKPQKKITGGLGEIIESPVIHNFKEGLTVLEYFVSTHGARKGLADTALKTADAGYLTRRLVDVAQDVIVNIEDCGTVTGIEVGPLKEGEEIIEPLADRVLGRVAVEDIVDPISGEVLVKAGAEIDEAASAAIDESRDIEKVMIRSVLKCEAPRGVCAKCYGRNLATGRMVEIGEAVGVIAAQSIGEPGTQLTLRTFHIGGTASRIVEQSRIKAKVAGKIYFHELETVERTSGTAVVVGHKGQIELQDTDGKVRNRYSPPYGATLHVRDGAMVAPGDDLFEWDTFNTPILTEKAGTVRFVDIKEKVTVRDEVDENTGLRLMVIIDDREKVLHPHVDIVSPSGKRVASYPLPTGARLLVRDGHEVTAGEVLVKIRREISKTRDITGGLPRVSELFEARKPKDAATVSEIDGRVEFGGVSRGMKKMLVIAETGESREYLIPQGKHLHVQEGDFVHAGDRLTEGPVNPHDTLKIKGIQAVQEYLVNEIQEVYRLQGVRIDDKHIETIVRQMLQKIRVDDPGDTNFLEGEQVDKSMLKVEQARVEAEGGQPATYQPLLLGITKASLSTQSFISSASFQETTRVLTEASVLGMTDHLRGLKENVIIGHLIPAGTGVQGYKELEVVAAEEDDVEKPSGDEEEAKTA